MPMSDDEKKAYLDEIGPQIEAAADAAFMKTCGRTFRGDQADLARAARLAKIPHAERNGDSSPHPDSLEKVKRDFPSLFGEGA